MGKLGWFLFFMFLPVFARISFSGYLLVTWVVSGFEFLVLNLAIPSPRTDSCVIYRRRIQPSLRDSKTSDPFPGVETPGYSR
jgi:hypothetical protein